MNSNDKQIISLRELLKRSLSALKNPKAAYENLPQNTEVNRLTLIPFLFIWGGFFIIAHFYIAQRVNIFIYNHSLITIPTIALYGYLIWKLGSLFFWGLSKILNKKLTLYQAEIGTFYIWFIWATMPLFDLPHILFDLPVVLIGGAGAHTSWIYAFPYFAIFAFFFIKGMGLSGWKDWSIASLVAIGVPIIGRYFIEQVPVWLHFYIRDSISHSLAPGFHLASLWAVLIALVVGFAAFYSLRNYWMIFPSLGAGVLACFAVTFIWIQLLPFAPTIRHSNTPVGVQNNYIYDANSTGQSRGTFSFTWTGSDLEAGTITHGPYATSTYWADYYIGAVDFDFNPNVHTIDELRFDVNITTSTSNDSTITGPNMQICLKGGSTSTYFCSAWQDNLSSTTLETTFTINKTSIRTYADSSTGALARTDDWESLINGLDQFDNDLLVHTYTAGTEDDNTEVGDIIEWDQIIPEAEYEDKGELQMVIASSSVVASTTSATQVQIMTLASSSLSSSTYLVIWGAQLAGNDTSAQSLVTLARSSSSDVTISYNRGEATGANPDNPSDGNSYSGFWIGHLNGKENLKMSYQTILGSDVAYIGARFIQAIRIGEALVEGVDYWSNGSQESSANALTNAGTSYTNVTSTTETYHASQTQNYLVLASMETGISGTANQECSARVNIGGTFINASDRDMESANDIHAYTFARQVSIGSGSISISLQGKSEATTSCDYRRPRIYVFRSNIFDQIDSATSTGETSTSVESWTAKVSNTYTPNQIEKYAVIANAMLDTNSDTRPETTQIRNTTESTTYNVDFGILNNKGTGYWPILSSMLYEANSTSSNTYQLMHRRADGSGAVDIKEASLLMWSQKINRHYEQSSYRWFENSDSVLVGSPLAAENTSTTAPEQGTPFRLRMLIHVETSTLPAGSQPFKLQFAERSGSCDTGFSGESYSDVERDSGTIRFYDNSTPDDANTATATSTDPTHGGDTVVMQGYEEANSFAAVSPVAPGEDGLWDFSLIDNSATAGTSYCFRAVKIDGTELDTYTVIPEITAAGAAPSIGSVTLNNNSDIILTPATTTRIYASSTVSDSDGDIEYATSTFYRSGIGSECSHNDQNCIQVASSNCAFNSGTSTVACYADVWYFAQATGDASSSFPSESWRAAITVVDQVGSSASTSSAADTVDIGLITAIDSATSSIDFSTVNAGTDTGTSTTNVNVVNYGNTSSTLRVSGTNLTSGGDTINVSNIEYASSTFEQGTIGQTLSTTPTTISNWVMGAPPGDNRPYFATSTSWVWDKEYCCSAFFAKDGYFHQVGGLFTTDLATSTAIYAPISPTGTLGTFQITTSLPGNIRSPGYAQYKNYRYVVGGLENGGGSTSSIHYAVVNNDGTLSSWKSAGSLPTSTGSLSSLIYNEKLYYFGGTTPSGVTSTIQYADINSDGTLGSWTNTTPGPVGAVGDIANGNFAAYKGYMYSVSAANALDDEVYYAPINTDGSLGSWTQLNSLPAIGFWVAAEAHGGFLYAIGGFLSAENYYTPINEDGTIGEWSILPARKSPVGFGTNTVIYNGRLYSGGGFTGVVTNDTFIHNYDLSTRDTHWGLTVPVSTSAGTYTGTVTLTSSFSP